MIGLRLVEIPSALFPECSIDGDMYARTYRRLFHEFNTEDADWIIDDFGKLLDIVSE